MNNKRTYHFVIFWLLLFLWPVLVQAQKLPDKVEELYRHTEQIYSTDDLLVNGQVYIPTRRKAKGSPYFGEKTFIEGNVLIKGRQFEDLLLAYNLESQRLILRAALESGKYVTISLNPNLVDAFTIGTQEFINAEWYFNKPGFSGYYTLVYEGDFAFLVSYDKTFRAVYDTQTPDGSYSEMQVGYFIFEDGKFKNVTKKKALLNHFPMQKKEIKSFMRKNKIQYKKAGLYALSQLMKYCDSVSTHP